MEWRSCSDEPAPVWGYADYSEIDACVARCIRTIEARSGFLARSAGVSRSCSTNSVKSMPWFLAVSIRASTRWTKPTVFRAAPASLFAQADRGGFTLRGKDRGKLVDCCVVRRRVACILLIGGRVRGRRGL